MFRKDVPRLIFVFTNEYDNEVTKYLGGVTGIEGNRVSVFPFPADGSIKFECETSEKDQFPPDPYCLSIVKTT